MVPTRARQVPRALNYGRELHRKGQASAVALALAPSPGNPRGVAVLVGGARGTAGKSWGTTNLVCAVVAAPKISHMT